MKIYDKKHGIDISKWQGRVDWGQLSKQHKAGQLDFVIIRAGLGGGTVDPRFEEYYAAARAAGIPAGAYWYAYWGPYTPSQEAASFLRAVEGKILQYGLWYDVEYEPDILGMGKAERTSKVLEGLGALAASGRYVGLYASTDMVNNRLEYGRLRGYDLWCAQYASRNTCKLPYGIWQYTSGGSVPGIAGRVDRDRAYKDYPAFVVGPLAGEAAPDKPAPEPGPDAGTQGSAQAGDGAAEGAGPQGNERPGTSPREDEGSAGAQGNERPGTSPREDEGAREPRETVTRRYGPMTRGDLARMLQKAEGLGLYLLGEVTIGPASSGDDAALRALAAELGLGCEKVG